MMQDTRRRGVARLAWQAAGLAALGTGVVGIVVPLLPTTPFLLLAAFCFCRGSQRLHDWLIMHPRFGPPIEDWRRHGAISYNAKAWAAAALAVTFGISIIMGAPGYVLAIQIVVLTAVAVFIFTRPAPPEGAITLDVDLAGASVSDRAALSGSAAADD